MSHILETTEKDCGGKNESNECQEGFSKKYYLSLSWLSMLVFVVSSSFVFTYMFEWDKYHAICDPMSHIMSMPDKVLVFCFLVAKSILWFLPFIGIFWFLTALNFVRISIFFLITFWLFTFSMMTIDLILYSLHGAHILDHVRWVSEALQETPYKFLHQFWDFIGIKLAIGAIIAMVVFMISVPATLFSVRWVVTRLAYRFMGLVSGWSMAIVIFAALLFPLAIVPVPEQFRDRVIDALPVAEGNKKVLGCLFQAAHSFLGLASQIIPEWQNPDHDKFVTNDEIPFVAKIVNDALNSNSAGTISEVNLTRPNPPNIIVIALESFRSSLVDFGSMKNLGEWSKQGLRLNRHYSGCNGTRPGLFALFSGHVALDQIADDKISFQMIELFKRLGFNTSFITYGDSFNWGGVDDWYKSIPCDIFLREGNYSMIKEEIRDWPDSDRRKINHAKHILNTYTDKPNFVFVFLLSSHWPYAFPKELDIFKSDKYISKFWSFFNFDDKVKLYTNRYMNTMLFLDKEIAEFVSQLDPSRNIVIVTGDHGESMGEDGGFGHGARPSEVQLRTPFIMVGPGVAPREINTATAHNDVLPTLLHVIAGRNVTDINASGRDLLADPAPADRVVVTAYRGKQNVREILSIHGNKRLAFKLDTNLNKSERPELIGGIDEAGQFNFKVQKDKATIGFCW